MSNQKTTQKKAGRPVDNQKNRAIIEAAQALLFSRDKGAFSIEAVARLAGVSKSTIYARYKNRSELIEEIIFQRSKSYSLDFCNVPDNKQDMINMLNEFGLRLLAFLLSDEHLCFMRNMSQVSSECPSILKKVYLNGPQATLEQLTLWLNKIDQQAICSFKSPQTSAELFLGMLIGLNVVRSMYGEDCYIENNDVVAHVKKVVGYFIAINADS